MPCRRACLSLAPCALPLSGRYGYVFAAAEHKLKHILTEGVVVYPDEIGAGRYAAAYPRIPARASVSRVNASHLRLSLLGIHARREEASIIHYGLHCAVGSFRFTKYTFGNFDAVGCTGKTFGEPPAPTHTVRRDSAHAQRCHV